jgi:hypothetical protein
MSPVTHFFTGWLVASSARLNRRERAAVTVAAVIPDIDGAGAIAEVLTRHSAHPLLWFTQYHHALHNLLFGFWWRCWAFALANRRWLAAGLAFAVFHLHLLEDVIGSRSPDGFQWPVPYLSPFTSRFALCWSGQWQLTAWPNAVFTLALVAITLWAAVRKGVSPVSMFSEHADCAVVAVLRDWFHGAPTQT